MQQRLAARARLRARALAGVLPGLLLCAVLALGGAAVVAGTGLAIPGAVLGLVAYLALLAGGVAEWSRPGAALLLRWMGALIVPALVGLTAYAAVLARAAWPLAAVLVATTLLTALATAAIFRAAGRRG